MSIQSWLGKWLLRAAVSLGFLGCFLAAETNQAATSESSVGAGEAYLKAGVVTPGFDGRRCANLNIRSHLMLTSRMEISLLLEFGLAVEDNDSLEMMRVDLQQSIGGIDWVEVGPKVVSKALSHSRPNISPPLLV